MVADQMDIKINIHNPEKCEVKGGIANKKGISVCLREQLRQLTWPTYAAALAKLFPAYMGQWQRLEETVETIFTGASTKAKKFCRGERGNSFALSDSYTVLKPGTAPYIIARHNRVSLCQRVGMTFDEAMEFIRETERDPEKFALLREKEMLMRVSK